MMLTGTHNMVSSMSQFTTTGTRCYLWLKQSQSNSLQGHKKHFYLYLGVEQSGRGWKDTWKTGTQELTSQTMVDGFFFPKRFVWPCSNVVQIDKTLVYSILHATVQAIWHRSLYSYSTKQLPTVTRLWTVAKLVLCRTIRAGICRE